MKKRYVSYAMIILMSMVGCHASHLAKSVAESKDQWLLIDDFEATSEALNSQWKIRDVQNDTQPRVNNPQIAKVLKESNGNQYYLKKAAADGVIGNRKALSYIALPRAVEVGEIVTFYTRIMVDAFPNNHSFGLSNLLPAQIDQHSYNAFEPMLRVTDKTESNGYMNTGALMAIQSAQNGKAKYQDIMHEATNTPAKPLQTKTWYELWYVVDNAPVATDATSKRLGQRYDIYIKGGEFIALQKVFVQGMFRMQRAQPLTTFVTIANTGPKKQPYGNGGLAYDDIYMSSGINLSTPQRP